eukprot:355027-Chlamydomonas_euryale.AAC.10
MDTVLRELLMDCTGHTKKAWCQDVSKPITVQLDRAEPWSKLPQQPAHIPNHPHIPVYCRPQHRSVFRTHVTLCYEKSEPSAKPSHTSPKPYPHLCVPQPCFVHPRVGPRDKQRAVNRAAQPAGFACRVKARALWDVLTRVRNSKAVRHIVKHAPTEPLLADRLRNRGRTGGNATEGEQGERSVRGEKGKCNQGRTRGKKHQGRTGVRKGQEKGQEKGGVAMAVVIVIMAVIREEGETLCVPPVCC